MIELLKKFIKLPLHLKLKLIFSPIFYFIEVFLSWVISLWNSRVLVNGKWSSYMGFCPNTSLLHLFYKTQWLNFERHGRQGFSKTLSGGNYDLSKWWHLSLPASSIYSNPGRLPFAYTFLG